MPRKAFRIVKQLPDGESLKPQTLNLCRCCYRPISEDHRVHYCAPACRKAHQRLAGMP